MATRAPVELAGAGGLRSFARGRKLVIQHGARRVVHGWRALLRRAGHA